MRGPSDAEEIAFHPEALSQGRLARLKGHEIVKSNPFDAGSWLWKSFRVGWSDVDMDEHALKEPIGGGVVEAPKLR